MTQNNLKIAITGGIGSGKSTVSEIIKEAGYNVISCDLIYRGLLNDKFFLSSIVDQFGNVLNSDGSLNKAKLSEIVFDNEDKLHKLNELTHPAIMAEALKQMSGKGIYFCEVPLLFEGGYEKLFDIVLIILRDKDKRISSVAQRDQIDKTDVKKRINNQIDYNLINYEKYYVIHNDLDLANLRKQTVNFIQNIVKK